MYKDNIILGIIPARGGSKGLPGKNILPLLGKPLLVWSIEEAKRSKHIDRLIVSTDDEEIAAVAREYGAEVPFLRPAEFAQDTSVDLEFFEHALLWLREHEGYEPDVLLRLPPTSPLRSAVHIDEGIEVLVNTPEADTARSVTPADRHPYRAWKVSGSERLIEPFLPEGFTGTKDAPSQPRQSYPHALVQTGALDVIRTRTVLELRSTVGKKVAPVMMDPHDAINIDNEHDFFIAEALLHKRML